MYPSTRGRWVSRGRGGESFNLNDITTLDVGHTKDDPCFAPHRYGDIMCACFVANTTIE